MPENDYIGAIIGLIVILPILAIFLSAFTALSCTNEKSQIADLASKYSACSSNLQDLHQDLNYWESKYQKLIDENVTKRDFIDLKMQVSDLNYQLNQTNFQLISINQQVQNFNNVMNLSLTINFILLPLTLLSLFDFALLDFRYSKKIRSFGVRIYHSIRSKVIFSDPNKPGENSG